MVKTNLIRNQNHDRNRHTSLPAVIVNDYCFLKISCENDPTRNQKTV